MDFEKLATRYRGPLAKDYDRRRIGGEQWRREQQGVDATLAKIPAGSSILDIPAGTGRFLELYARHNLRASGMDVSADMLAEAAAKAREIGSVIDLRVGDIRKIDAADGSFDCALCMRFLNWVDFDGLRIALGELSRVTRAWLILGMTCKVDESVRKPRPLSLWEQFQARRKRNRQRRKGTMNFDHDSAAVLRMFGELGLAVADVVTLDMRDNNVDYRIYLLSRAQRT